MWKIFEYFSILHPLTLVAGNHLINIRDDYCELYLNASKINEKSCSNNGKNICTNEYELLLFDTGVLDHYYRHIAPPPNSSGIVLIWTRDNLIEWISVAITNEMINLTSLRVMGIPSSEDPRLRPGSFYLNKLIVENVQFFSIIAEQFVIYEYNSHYEMGPQYLHIQFEQSVYLGKINEFIAASTKRLKQLHIQGLHLPGSELCSYLQFFSLPVLQENVEELSLDVNMRVNMQCFENYRKLKYIVTERPYEPFENLTAQICNYLWQCKLSNTRNALRCPANCTCFFKDNLKIECRDRNNRQIPPLPTSTNFKIELIYSGMQLMQLPNNTLPGYMEVIRLNVSDNKISSLALYQLPWNLRILDISNNPITTIDNSVANYLNEHSTNVYQSGIKWTANCGERAFLTLLHSCLDLGTVFFKQLNGECPDRCQCCFDQKTENFVVDCSSEAVGFPALPNRIPYNVSLLLGNCSIKELPTNLVKTYNITHLDLRNNYLKSLDEETVDFYNNYLKSLDEETVDFYNKHDDTTIELSGNPWSCICKPRSFLFFLKYRSPADYRSALARCKIQTCPDSCVCCLDVLNSSALNVDCRGQRLTQFPLLPDSITSLDLRDNNVTEINQQSQTFLNNKILSRRLTLFLSGNPWDCTCELFSNAKNNWFVIQDFTGMKCSNLGKHLALVEEIDVCPSYFIYPLLLFVFIMIIITALNAFVYFKQPILMWFYEHEICMSMAVREDLERLKKFDAFLCFTHKDEHLIEDYVERLENGQRKFRLCFYLRDWNIGASIPECIIQSVKDSRRIIILMTKNFLESTWGKLEFRLALHATSKDRCKRLIVILYPDVENFDDLDSELKAYMVLNTYLRRDSPNFWNKLLYSMPHIS